MPDPGAAHTVRRHPIRRCPSAERNAGGGAARPTSAHRRPPCLLGATITVSRARAALHTRGGEVLRMAPRCDGRSQSAVAWAVSPVPRCATAWVCVHGTVAAAVDAPFSVTLTAVYVVCPLPRWRPVSGEPR